MRFLGAFLLDLVRFCRLSVALKGRDWRVESLLRAAQKQQTEAVGVARHGAAFETALLLSIEEDVDEKKAVARVNDCSTRLIASEKFCRR